MIVVFFNNAHDGAAFDRRRVPRARGWDRAAAAGREIGIAPGVFPTRSLNAITDVAGLKVGHATIVEGDEIHRGHRHPAAWRQPVSGESRRRVFVGNAIRQACRLNPGRRARDDRDADRAHQYLGGRHRGRGGGENAYTLAQPGNEGVARSTPWWAETNDAELNDIRRMPVRREHVFSAIRDAKDGPVKKGASSGDRHPVLRLEGGLARRRESSRLGMAGTRWGCSCRRTTGGVLTLAGAPVGKELGRYSFAPPPQDDDKKKEAQTRDDGSCMIVVATDAPLDARDLRRLAARAIYGMGRTGASYANSRRRLRLRVSQPRPRFGTATRPWKPRTAQQNHRRPGPCPGSHPRTRRSTTRCSRPRPSSRNEHGRRKPPIPIDRRVRREILKKYRMISEPQFGSASLLSKHPGSVGVARRPQTAFGENAASGLRVTALER